MSEFSVIDRFFKPLSRRRNDVREGIGDDGAVISVPAGHELVVSTDTLNAGIHFPEHTSPCDIGHKSLAVNLSDMAAMGAIPCWVTLALSLPKEDEVWLTQFVAGFESLCNQFDVALIGGDTTRGPLSITVTVMGIVPDGQARLRRDAKAGDFIGVSGRIGDGALGLALSTGRWSSHVAQRDEFVERLNRPTPRVQLGLALRPVVRAMIDISDGLLADLGHILEASNVGAHIDVSNIPVSPIVTKIMPEFGGWSWPLGAGDDYELCFTFAPERVEAIREIADQCGVEIAIIGQIEHNRGLRVTDGEQNVILTRTGYDHFRTQ